MVKFNKNDYDNWVVQKRPNDVLEKNYDDYDWEVETKGLDYEEAKKRAKQQNEADYNKNKNGKQHYLYRHYPQKEV